MEFLYYQTNILKSYFIFFKNQIGIKLIYICGLTILSTLSESLGIMMIIPLLQTIYVSANENFFLSNYLVQILGFFNLSMDVTIILFVITILFVIKAVIIFSTEYLIKFETVQLYKKLQSNSFEMFEYFSYESYEKKDKGYYLNFFITQIPVLANILHSFVKLITSVIVLIFYLLLFFFYATESIIVIVIFASLLSFFFIIVNDKIKNYSIKLTKLLSKQSSIVHEHLNSYYYLFIKNKKNLFRRDFKDINENIGSTKLHIGKLQSFTVSIKEPLIISFIIIFLVYQINFLNRDIAIVFALILMLYKLALSVYLSHFAWMECIDKFGSFKIVSNKLSKIFQNKKNDINNDKKKIDNINSIKLVDIYFKHKEQSDFLFNKLNLEFNLNKAYLLFGRSGSGKSSLLNLILGAYKPIKGEILLNNQNILDFDLNSFRENISIVPQRYIIFNKNILFNLFFNKNSKLDSKISLLSKKIGIFNLISKLKKNINGSIKDSISGGESQRIALLRELIDNKQILILDEPTSSLDEKSSKLLIELISQLKLNKIVIIVSHDKNFIKVSDHVINFEKF